MNLQSLLPFLLIAVLIVPMVLMGRKQKKAMQQQQELQNSLSVGDRVMTTSGLYATVTDTSDDATIELEVAPGVETTWLPPRSARRSARTSRTPWKTPRALLMRTS